MNNSHKQGTFLAKWIEGEINNSELKTFVSEQDYYAMLRLRDRLDLMKSPEPDFQTNYIQTQGRISNNFLTLNNRRMLTSRMIGIAASIFLIIMLGSYHIGLVGEKKFISKSTFQKVQINSAVQATLNHQTALIQKAPLYNANVVYLEKGEAYFEVVKGNPFLIETPYGNVRVLGTKFTVKSNKNLFEVRCFEGKVAIDYDGKIYYARKGTYFSSESQQVALIPSLHTMKPEWLMEYKIFERKNFGDVVAFISKLYDVRIAYDKSFSDMKFTGAIPKNNLDDALNVICHPFNLSFKLHDKNIIIKK